MKMYLVASISFMAISVLAIVVGMELTAGIAGFSSGYFFNEWRWLQRIARVQKIRKLPIEDEPLEEYPGT